MIIRRQGYNPKRRLSRCMPVVTIARPIGSSAEEIASGVSERLGFALFDEQLLAMAADRGHVPVDAVGSLDERGRGLLRRPSDLWKLVPMPPIDLGVSDVLDDVYPPTGPVSARGSGLASARFWAVEAYATLVTRTIRDIAATQDAVIVGRAGHVSLANQSGVLRVLCVASEATRIARVMKAGQLSPSEARHRLHESDRDSRDFHAEFFHSDWMDPRAYDLVISTDALAVDQAVEAIVAIARTVHGRPEPMSHALHH